MVIWCRAPQWSVFMLECIRPARDPIHERQFLETQPFSSLRSACRIAQLVAKNEEQEKTLASVLAARGQSNGHADGFARGYDDTEAGGTSMTPVENPASTPGATRAAPLLLHSAADWLPRALLFPVEGARPAPTVLICQDTSATNAVGIVS